MKLIGFLFFIFIHTSALLAQGFFSNVALGINLPPIIGNTMDIRIETNPNPNVTFQLSTSIMIDNDLRGTYNKKDDNIDNQLNSGIALALSVRFNSHESMEAHSLFIGYKIMGGVFEQKGINRTYNQLTNKVDITRIKAERNFIAIGVEMGASLRISDKFSIDIGGQISYPIFHDELLSDINSNLPGIGSIFNLQGTLAPKFYF